MDNITLFQATLVAACLSLAGDVFTTIAVLRQGGYEMNPVMKWIMSKIGVAPGLLITHTAAAVFIAFLGLWWVNVVFAIAFGFATLWNASKIRGAE